MDTNISDYVKTKLQSCNLATLRLVAGEIDVPYNTLLRIKYQDVNPRIETVQPIYSYFKNQEAA